MKTKDEITVVVNTGQGPFTGDFPKTAKVADVIVAVIAKFGYPEDGKYSLVIGTDILEPERTLVSYHIEDGTTMQLSDTGGGV